MVRISRLTDYGIILLTYMTSHPERLHNATGLAAGAHLPLPTVSKLLRDLAGSGLLVSHRGVKGGYELARPAREISVAEIITVLEGPVALTVCSSVVAEACEHEALCPVQGHWQKISGAIQSALENVMLADMASPARALSATARRTSAAAAS
jgi:FeS assembly SUF system regulator